MAAVLIIEADARRRARLADILEFIEVERVHAAGPGDWQKEAESGGFSLCLLGDCGDGGVRRRVVNELAEWDPGLAVMLLDGEGIAPLSGGVPTVLGSLELPLRLRQVSSALERAEVFRERSEERERRPLELFRSLVGTSRRIQDVRRMIEQVAESDATVLILGESGTGKEVVARNIHYHSRRRDKPFVPINCGAIPADLLESELFGHEKGAFTGAINARKGRFEMAQGGTLFLDEIGDMSLPMQVKLLRVLQERTFERVGSNKSIQADVRVIAATHRDLEQRIEEGKFREDLYYRLNVFPIDMPPLRERAEDIPLLLNELIARVEHEKRGSVRLTPAAVMGLTHYPWPGNVRELANLVERLVIMYPFKVVDLHQLPPKYRVGGEEGPALPQSTAVPMEWLAAPRLPREGLDLKEHLANLEYHLIKQALDETGGVVAHAAKLLHMRRTTLVEKLRKYGLSPSNHRQEFDETLAAHS